MVSSCRRTLPYLSPNIPKNAIGKKIRETDPLGRTTVYNYAPNDIDLLEIKQVNGQNLDLLKSLTYNTQHRPLTVTDIAGQTTQFSYNAQGQLLTITNAKNETLTHTYDSNGYLTAVAGPAPGSGLSYGFDGYGRVRTVTDSESYTRTYDYDALDRITRVTYPDGTYEETVYNRLDPEKRRDRLGRWTQIFYDALRRPVATRDAAGGTTQYQYGGSGCTSCAGGGDKLTKLIDPNGNATTWEYDLQGRVTQETKADGGSTQFVYENTTSQLRQITDPKLQVSEFQYYLDDNLKQVSYTNAQVQTPTVAFTYDSVFNRLATVQDGTGTTTYTYNPITTTPALGAGRLASVDGPLVDDTISYTYDELGRVVGRLLNGSSSTQAYDSLARISTQANALGTFTHSYVGATNRLASASLPNGQTAEYAYYGNGGDHRTQQIKHLASGGVTISQHDYTYDAVGNIATWRQQVGTNPAKLYTFGYDAANQLTTARVTGPDPLPVPSRFAYSYDGVGNRTAEQLDDAVTGATHNSRNQLTSRQAGGALVFKGSVDEPSTVRIQGKQVVVAPDNAFVGQAEVSAGTSNVAVVATDPSGNTRTNTYQLSQASPSTLYAFDSNGNVITDGTRTFEWDAENRLVAVLKGTKRTEFNYDGFGRRSRTIAKDNGVVSSDTRFVWCQSEVCEERDSNTNAVVRRFFPQGMEELGVPYFYAHDHLGSVREMTDGASTVRARYDYDPYGRLTKVGGDKDAFFGFTGEYVHPSGTGAPEERLQYLGARYYDPDIGRFLSADPVGLAGGINPYAYSLNNPANWIDPSGLGAVAPRPKPPGMPKPCDWWEKGCKVPPPSPPPPSGPGGPSCIGPDKPFSCPYTKPCTKYFDETAYWACIAYRMAGGDVWQGPPWTSPCSAATAAMQCADAATFCLEGGAPPGSGPNSGPGNPNYPPMVPHQGNRQPPVKKGHFH